VNSGGQLQEESLDFKSELQGSPPGLEIKFTNINTDFETFQNDRIRFRLRLTIKDLEVLDHITSSEYTKFMAAVVPDSNQRPRESSRDMIKLEFSQFNPRDPESGIPEHNIKVFIHSNNILGSCVSHQAQN
jgi:hypothetical protein